MVTRIHQHAKPRLYLKEHREARGISPEAMAGRLEIERESVYRWEREQRRLNPEKLAAYAHALGDEVQLEDLFRMPGRPSIDAMIKNAPESVQTMAADIVRRLVAAQK